MTSELHSQNAKLPHAPRATTQEGNHLQQREMALTQMRYVAIILSLSCVDRGMNTAFVLRNWLTSSVS